MVVNKNNKKRKCFFIITAVVAVHAGLKFANLFSTITHSKKKLWRENVERANSIHFHFADPTCLVGGGGLALINHWRGGGG